MRLFDAASSTFMKDNYNYYRRQGDFLEVLRGCGDAEVAEGGGTFPFNASDASEMKESDAEHLHTFPERHQGMAKLVQKNRCEQEQGGQQTEPPASADIHLCRSRIVRLENHGEQNHGEQPARLDPQRNAADLEQLPAFSHSSSDVCRCNDRTSVILGRENQLTIG